MKHLTKFGSVPALGLAMLLLCLVVPSGAQAQSFTDDQFADGDWSAQFCPDVPMVMNSSFVAVQDAAAGNGEPSRHVAHTYDARIYLCHLRATAIVAPSQSAIAAIDFALDGQYDQSTNSSASCFAYGALVRQNGVFFQVRPFWQACSGDGWESFNSSLAAADFVRVDQNEEAEVQHPDFSCGGAPIELGFITGNQTGRAQQVREGLTTEAWADNWAARVQPGESCAPLPPPPAPYQCYDILDHSQDLHPGRRVATDQFGEMESRFGHPVALCNPAAVGEEYSEDQSENETHYVCYQTLGRNRDRPRRVVISNAFDQDNELVLGGRDMICLPSSKRVVERAEE